MERQNAISVSAERRALRPACAEPLETRRLLSAGIAKDLNTAGIAGDPEMLTVVGNDVFFRAKTDNSGQNYFLFKSDGTAAGTLAIKKIYPWQTFSSGGYCYFIADDSSGTGRELWRSDGTPAGTILLKDINPGPDESGITQAVDINGTLYFQANDGVHGAELWTSNGTPEGTVMVADINPGAAGSGASMFAPLPGGQVAFRASDGTSGAELWKTDGTAPGTSMIKDINPGPGQSWIWEITKVGSRIFFRADDGEHGGELWTSDGTPAGTYMVKDIVDGWGDSNCYEFTEYNGKCYFSADDWQHSYELWVSDGTEAGTYMLKDLYPGDDSSYGDPYFLTVSNGLLFMWGRDAAHGYELWQSDATEAGTIMVKDINPGPADSLPQVLTDVNGTLFFEAETAVNGREVWKSSGYDATMVKEIKPGTSGSQPWDFHKLGSSLIFTADDGKNGYELWTSDGTSPGTHMVKDVAPINDSTTALDITQFGDSIYFRGYDGKDVYLYKMNEVDGVVPITRIAGSLYGVTGYLRNVSGTLYFAGDDGTHQSELWRSDGTPAGTYMIKDINPTSYSRPHEFVSYNGAVYFFADDGSNGTCLWKTDGTSAGTVRISGNLGFSPGFLTVAYGSLFWLSGQSVYKSDGSTAGTQIVYTFGGFYQPWDLTNVNGKLLFTATDDTHGSELWTTDGVTTAMVADATPGAAGTSPSTFLAAGSTLYFISNNSTSASALWKSDGTAAGTVLVKSFGAPDMEVIQNLQYLGGLLYFSVGNGSVGYELWRSDGTPAGTYQLKDIMPGAIGSNPSTLATFNGQQVFFASDGTNGMELWRTDGTTAGTYLLDEITAGPDTLFSGAPTALGNVLYFLHSDLPHGNEWWWYSNRPGVSLSPAGSATLRLSAARDTIEYYVNNVLVSTYARDSIGRITITGSAGSDDLTIDLTNGNPLAWEGLTYDGGAGANVLRLKGSTGDDLIAIAGSTASIGAGNVSFANVSSIIVEGGAGDDTLDYSGASVPVSFPRTGGSDILNVTGGTFTFNADAGAGGSGSLAVNVDGGTVAFSASQHLAALNITAYGTATMPPLNSRLITGTLSIGIGGILDLSDNDLIVSAGSYTAILQLVVSGLTQGNGIISSAATGDETLSLFDNALVGQSQWEGEPLTPGAIVGKYTFFADLNFDGRVTGDDYTIIDAHLNTTPPTGLAAMHGDANFDGAVTGDDYTLVDASLGLGVGAPLAPLAIRRLIEIIH